MTGTGIMVFALGGVVADADWDRRRPFFNNGEALLDEHVEGGVERYTHGAGG